MAAQTKASLPINAFAAELREALRTPDETAVGDLPVLTYTDLRLVSDLTTLSGREDPESQALILALLVARDEGSMCVRLESEHLARRLSGVFEEGLEVCWADRVFRAFADGGCADHFIGPPDGTVRPLVREDTQNGSLVYFDVYYRAKKTLEERFRKLVENHLGDAQGLGERCAAIRGVFREHPQRLRDGTPAQIDPWQVAAVALALTRRLTVVSGGPGTGKTSVVCSLLRCFARGGMLPEDIRLAAPSGRAAQRMTEALQAALDSLEHLTSKEKALRHLHGSTVHTMLGYNPARGDFWHHSGNPLPARLVVVDEVSMVDAQLMSQLLDALLPEAKLVLLGDRDQLPSVDCGAVLSDLIPAGPDVSLGDSALGVCQAAWEAVGVNPEVPAQGPKYAHVVVLRRNYRSGRGVADLAEAISRGDDADKIVGLLQGYRSAPPELDLTAAQGCVWLDPGALPPDADPTAAWTDVQRKWLQAWLDDGYAQLVNLAAQHSYRPIVTERKACEVAKDILDRVFSARALSLLREGPYGAGGMNLLSVRSEWQRLQRAGRPGPDAVYPGMPVLVTRNDTATGLWNGDVGVVVKEKSGGFRVLFRKPDGLRAYPVAELPEWSPAYAMTVHKAQGSEYDRVLVVVPPEHGRRLLSREMLYTAVTRARSLVVIYATADSLREALSRRVERTTGIELFA